MPAELFPTRIRYTSMSLARATRRRLLRRARSAAAANTRRNSGWRALGGLKRRRRSGGEAMTALSATVDAASGSRRDASNRPAGSDAHPLRMVAAKTTNAIRSMLAPAPMTPTV
jgi:hypothetical protein